MNEKEDINDNMAHSHIEHSNPKEKEEHKKQSEIDLKTVTKRVCHLTPLSKDLGRSSYSGSTD
jgi:hypothetical protein